MINVVDFPKHWRIKPAWSLFRRVKRTGYPDLELLSVYREYGVIPKRSRDDNHNVASEDLSAYQLVKRSDLVVNKMKAWQGSFAISEFEGIVSPAYFVYTANHKENSRYLHYLLRSAPYMAHYNRISAGVRIGQWDLDPAQFRVTGIGLPPRAEQDVIVEFLDWELAQIDKLVQRQLKLEELIFTRKLAVISSSIYGLGVLSQLIEAPILPAGWVWRKLKDVATIQASNVDKKTYEDGVPVKLCNYVHVYYNDEIVADLDFMDATATPSEIAKFTLRAGQVIITKDSESESDIGVPAYVPADLPGVVCGYHLSILNSGPELDGKFLKLVLESAQAKSHFAKRANGLTRMALGQSAIGDLQIPLPPLTEQHRISSDVWKQLENMDKALTSSRNLVLSLRERRQALIAAAVTGKIETKET
jgi:type I restriction enzyme, S subunit